MNLTILSLESFHTLHREYKESTSEYVQDIAFVYGQKVFKQVPLRITDDRHGWCGRTKRLHIKDNISVMTQLHEAFHYFMCDPERLQYDDFGLGLGSESFGFQNPPELKMLGLDSMMEENSVCLLSISAAVHLNVPNHAIIEEMLYANMKELEQSEYNDCIALIKKRGLEQFGFNLNYL